MDTYKTKMDQSTEKFSDFPVTHIRKIISIAMHNSLQNSAQLTHHISANASGILQLRNTVKNKLKEGYLHDITLNDMICFAVISALKKHLNINAHFLGDKTRVFKNVNLGLAVDTKRGLMVPTLIEADKLLLPQLSDRLKELAETTKKGNISPDLLNPAAATFTVSNLGNYGVEMFTPIINLPQLAILGVNTILPRPVKLKDGSITLEPYIGLSLTYDHRALDGGPVTLFLVDIKKEIENISSELI
jgi:pyruvate dehydrogenase E2 component (dihydrolipoamide acetyltransferase)